MSIKAIENKINRLNFLRNKQRCHKIPQKPLDSFKSSSLLNPSKKSICEKKFKFARAYKLRSFVLSFCGNELTVLLWLNQALQTLCLFLNLNKRNTLVRQIACRTKKNKHKIMRESVESESKKETMAQ